MRNLASPTFLNFNITYLLEYPSNSKFIFSSPNMCLSYFVFLSACTAIVLNMLKQIDIL